MTHHQSPARWRGQPIFSGKQDKNVRTPVLQSPCPPEQTPAPQNKPLPCRTKPCPPEQSPALQSPCPAEPLSPRTNPCPAQQTYPPEQTPVLQSPCPPEQTPVPQNNPLSPRRNPCPLKAASSPRGGSPAAETRGRIEYPKDHQINRKQVKNTE